MPPLFGDTAAVLIVDDDPDLALVLETALELEGYDCTIVPDTEGARAALAEREYAVALVDIYLPGETGLEFVDRILDIHPALAVVMVSSISDPQIAELALQSGAYGYVVKPFNINQVIVTVSAASRRRCLEIERALYRERLETRFEEQADALDEAIAELEAFYTAARPDSASAEQR